MTCILLFAAVTAYMGCLSTALAEKLKKIDGFENLSLKIDGFGRTHRTHANDATEFTLENDMYSREHMSRAVVT